MDLVTDPLVREIWVMKSAQVGWTEILLNVAGYFIDLDPSPILLVQPTLEIAEAFSKDRLAPMIRDTPVLTPKIADPRARDSGNTLLHKKFNGGHLTLAGANSPQGLRSRPIRILLCDEVDGYPTSAGTEGDPFALARKRTTAFWNRKILAGSTPTIKGQSRVEAGYLNSDQRHLEYACPACGTFQRLVWAQVKWADVGLAPHDAMYQCSACSELLNEHQRLGMLGGEYRVVAAKPFNGIAGLHIMELMSPFVSLGEMATSFVEAKKLPETLQTWVNTALAETWADTARSIEPEGLLKRRENYGAERLPAGIVELTLGGDTQDDRLELQLLGWGRDEECWVLEQTVLRGDPGVDENAPNSVWRDLTTYRRRMFSVEGGRTLRVDGTAIDAGGHYTQQVMNYCHRHRFESVFAIAGKGGQGRLAWPRKPGKTKKHRGDLYSVGVDTIKDLLYGRIAKITPPNPGEAKPGYVHLPAGVDADFCDQLVSETKVYKVVGGRRVAVWRPKLAGVRQEAQDCWIYGYAVMIARTKGRRVDLNDLANAVEKRFGKPAPSADRAELAAPEAPAEGEPPPDDAPPDPRRPRPKRFRTIRSNYLQRK